MGAVKPEDIKQASRVLQACYEKQIVGHEVQEAIDNGCKVLAVKTGDKIVGVIIGERDMHEIYIRRIGVLPSHRGKGYGRGLINDLIRLDGIKILTMAVPRHDAGSVTFAHRCGFHYFGIDMNNEGSEIWRLSARADKSTRNRLEQFFYDRPSRIGDFGRRC